MAQNIVVNGVVYNGVNSISVPTSNGAIANFSDLSQDAIWLTTFEDGTVVESGFSDVTNISINAKNAKTISRKSDGMVLWGSPARLPGAYQEVEFIRADTGIGAYINLGFAFDTAATIKIGMYMSSDEAATYPFGAAENSGVSRCMISAPYIGAAYFYAYAGSTYQSGTVEYVKESLNEFVYTLGLTNVSMVNNTNGSTRTNTCVATEMTSDLYLFAQNYNGSLRYGGARQIHYFKYFDKEGNRICDLVPCYRKSDGVIGMYDIAAQKFFTNVGGGYFTKGADV